MRAQYDVELVHAIEGLMDRQLTAYDMPEEEVLKGITRVYAAKKKAALEAIELERRDKGRRGGAGGRKGGGQGQRDGGRQEEGGSKKSKGGKAEGAGS